MTDAKLCPLFSLGVIVGPKMPVDDMQTVAVCKREDCEWWSTRRKSMAELGDVQGCALRILAEKAR